MPCRTRLGGLDVEGFGAVYLEAAATGLPVIAGNSGGAPDAVRDGETGYVVPGGDVTALTHRLNQLLSDPEAAKAMGAKGRDWMEREWRWESAAERVWQIMTG
jgi:phosphatidylinositol alpha-1,6-mannosyltransferase